MCEKAILAYKDKPDIWAYVSDDESIEKSKPDIWICPFCDEEIFLYEVMCIGCSKSITWR